MTRFPRAHVQRPVGWLLLLVAAAVPAVAQAPAHHVLAVGDAVDGDGPTDIAWTPDGSTLVVLHEVSRDVTFLDGTTLAPTGSVPIGSGAADLALSPDGRYALVASRTPPALRVVDIASASIAAVVPLSGAVPYAIDVASDSSFAVVASYGDGTAPSSVSVVDLVGFQETFHFPAPGQASLWQNGEEQDPAIDLVADDRTLLLPLVGLQRLDGYDVTTGARIASAVPNDPLQLPFVVRSDPAGARAIAVCWDAFLVGYFEAYVLDLTSWSWTPVGVWATDPYAPTARRTRLTPDGSQAVLAGGSLYFVDMATASLASLPGASGDALEVTSDGATVVVAGSFSDPFLQAVDVATHAPTGASLRARLTTALVADPTGPRVAGLEPVDGEDVSLVDAAGGGLALLARAPTGPGVEGDGPTAIAVDPDGNFAVSANERSDNLTLFDLHAHAATDWIPVHDRPMDVRLIGGGRRAAVWHADGDLSIVDLTTRSVLERIPTGVQGARGWVWDPEPERMAVLGDDRVLLYGGTGAFDSLQAVLVEVKEGGSGVLAQQTVDQGWSFHQAPSVSAGGVVAFPQRSVHEVELLDASTLASLHELPTVKSPGAVVTTEQGFTYVGGWTELQRIQVQGTPQDLGKVAIQVPDQIRVDEAAGFAYVTSGANYQSSEELVVVDVAAMQVVATFDLGERIVDTALAGRHLFVALADGRLLRFRADGASTKLLSTHSTRGTPIQLVVSADGRTVLLVKRELDTVDELRF